MSKDAPKILIFDIETAPILGWFWNLFQQDIALNQIASDWHIMSWAAKWLRSSEVFYMDQRNAKKIDDDKTILKALWKLLDEADIVVTQNGKAFDSKKVNARFLINGLPPPSPYKHIDTKQLAKKNFAFTSNKLEYLSHKINKKYKKLKHSKFSGFELWKECLAGNIEAWEEMEKYNKHDVLATEELYLSLAPWGTGVDLNPYMSGGFRCKDCGSENLTKQGFKITKSGKYQQWKCRDCGSWTNSIGEKNNLFSKERRKELKG